MSDKEKLEIVLCAPRGFCAGVDRAIQIVEVALEKYGAPVYVRHEIVHNKYVVDTLKAKGAIFVEELSEIPDTEAPVVFSAHGVPKSVPVEAESREMFFLDATCPLVSKVHVEAQRHHADGYEIILIGHRGHPEVVGTMGQLPQEGDQPRRDGGRRPRPFTPKIPGKLAFVSQTTLSVDDTAEIVSRPAAALSRHAQAAQGRHLLRHDQQAGSGQAGRAPEVDAMIVVGAPNSSNSMRLVEVAERSGLPARHAGAARRRNRLVAI